MWRQWIMAILGAGVVLVGVLGISGAALLWTLTAFGSTLVALSVWSATALQADEEEEEEKEYATWEFVYQ
jgi:hypothetical protein